MTEVRLKGALGDELPPALSYSKHAAVCGAPAARRASKLQGIEQEAKCLTCFLCGAPSGAAEVGVGAVQAAREGVRRALGRERRRRGACWLRASRLHQAAKPVGQRLSAPTCHYLTRMRGTLSGRTRGCQAVYLMS